MRISGGRAIAPVAAAAIFLSGCIAHTPASLGMAQGESSMFTTDIACPTMRPSATSPPA